MNHEPMYPAGVPAAVSVFMTACWILTVGFSVVLYVLQSAGSYGIAKRRGIHHPWLAWIPVGILWIWGCISDQFQYLVKGRIRNRRKVLLTLGLVILGLAVAWGVVMGFLIAGLVERAFTVSLEQTVAELLPLMLAALGLLAVLAVVQLVMTILQYIVLYNVYYSCDPANSVMFEVLSIVFPGTLPFFLFFSRKRELGMPPRKKPVPPAAPVMAEPAVTDTPAEEAPASEPAEEVPASQPENPEETED